MQTYSCWVKLKEEDNYRNRRSVEIKDEKMKYVMCDWPFYVLFS